MAVLAFGSILAAHAGPAVFPEFTVTGARDYLQAVARMVQTQAVAEAEVSFMQARLQSRVGREDEAERLARQALAKEPQRADILSFLAHLCLRQERLEEALRCLRKAVQLDPRIPAGYQRLGMVLDRMGDRQGARTALEAGLRELPEDSTLHLLLGRLLLEENLPKEAALELEKSCRLNPDSANGFFVLSQARLRLGEKEAAQDALKTFKEVRQKEEIAESRERAEARDGDKFMRTQAAAFHTEAAALMFRQQLPELAEAHLRQARRIAPEEPRSYEMLSAACLKTGRLAAAREIYADMVRLWPSNAVYRANLGTLLLQMKEPSAAVPELKRALELDPKQPTALANLARCCLGARRETSEALALCLRLVDLEPTAANYDLLGWAYHANGQTNEARGSTAKAVEREPANPTYREHLRRLESAP